MGTLVLAQLAASEGRLASAHQVSIDTHLSLPTVSKLLKSLVRAGLAVSQRGARGGYALSRPAEKISAAEILDALEGAPGYHRMQFRSRSLRTGVFVPGRRSLAENQREHSRGA